MILGVSLVVDMVTPTPSTEAHDEVVDPPVSSQVAPGVSLEQHQIVG
jgi:hypothetical protein